MSAEAGGGGRPNGQSVPGGDVLLEVHTLVSDDLKTAAGGKQGHGDPGRVPVMVYAPAPPSAPSGRDRPGRRAPPGGGGTRHRGDGSSVATPARLAIQRSSMPRRQAGPRLRPESATARSRAMPRSWPA